MKIVDSISLTELKAMSAPMYGGIVKADIDVVKKIVIIDMEMHADGEAQLLEDGSKQSDLWGINLDPEQFGTDDFIEFDSMINIRPRQNNMHRGVEDPAIQQRIRDIIAGVIHE